MFRKSLLFGRGKAVEDSASRPAQHLSLPAFELLAAPKCIPRWLPFLLAPELVVLCFAMFSDVPYRPRGVCCAVIALSSSARPEGAHARRFSCRRGRPFR
jgi:hypothetical protein